LENGEYTWKSKVSILGRSVLEANFIVPRETPSSSSATMPSLPGDDLATDVRFRRRSLKRTRLLLLLSLSQPMSSGERETVSGEREENCTCELTRAGWKSSLVVQAMASDNRENQRECVCV
jgi:hypothetical protein